MYVCIYIYIYIYWAPAATRERRGAAPGLLRTHADNIHEKHMKSLHESSRTNKSTHYLSREIGRMVQSGGFLAGGVALPPSARRATTAET